MGATGWVRYVPYEDDFGEALRKARREVFLAGDYEAPPPVVGDDDFRAVLADLAAFGGLEAFGGVSEVVEPSAVGAAAPPPVPGAPEPRDDLDRDIERMLTSTMDRGSHSLLDVVTVGPAGGPGVVTPLTADELRVLFGTDRPTGTQVAQAEDAILQRCPRWEGRLVVVHDPTGSPTHLCFLGVSGA